jgi:hypothetical protein
MFDAVFATAATPDLAAINRYLPSGLRMSSAHIIPAGTLSLNAGVTAGRYSVTPLVSIDASTIVHAVNQILSSVEFKVPHERKNNGEMKDIRKLMYECRFCQETQSVHALLSMLPGATCRPSELIAAIFPDARFSDFLVRRVECLCLRDGQFVQLP